MDDQISVLLAEDDELDVLLLRRALKQAGMEYPLHVVRDGQEAIEFLGQKRGPLDRLPTLVILDLKMPRRDGIDVLRWMREQPILCGIPVIIFSSSGHPGDVEQAYELGANGFVVKPPSIMERLDFARFVLQWLRFNRPPVACTEGLGAAQELLASRKFSRPRALE